MSNRPITFHKDLISSFVSNAVNGQTNKQTDKTGENITFLAEVTI